MVDLIVDSSAEGLRKPDPAIFHLTLERLGGIAPEAVGLPGRRPRQHRRGRGPRHPRHPRGGRPRPRPAGARGGTGRLRPPSVYRGRMADQARRVIGFLTVLCHPRAPSLVRSASDGATRRQCRTGTGELGLGCRLAGRRGRLPATPAGSGRTGGSTAGARTATASSATATATRTQPAPSPPVASPAGPLVAVAPAGVTPAADGATGRSGCWGATSAGQLGNGPVPNADALDPVRLVVGGRQRTGPPSARGAGHTCGRRATGRLYCWGADVSGQLGDGVGRINRTRPQDGARRHLPTGSRSPSGDSPRRARTGER